MYDVHCRIIILINLSNHLQKQGNQESGAIPTFLHTPSMHAEGQIPVSFISVLMDKVRLL